MSKQNRILISYFPFLEGTAGHQCSTDDIEQIDQILDGCKIPIINGIAWVYYPFDKQETVIPVLVVDRAKELADHLVLWAENEIERRFDLFIDDRPEGYVLALMPNIDESIKRYKLARFAIYEEIVQDNNFQVLFGILGTICKNGTYKTIKDKLLKKTYVGFVGPDDLDKDQDSISIVGPVGIKDVASSALAMKYCDERFEEMLHESE